MIAEHPDWIGDRDGVPVWARSQVNIGELDREIADVQRQLDELGSREDFMNEADLNLADEHVFVMSSPDDPVSGDPTILGVPAPGLGDLNQLGPNPLTLPFERLSTDAAITGIDQVPRDASYGHSDYPRSTDNGLRTAGYDLAIIASGLAHDPKYPDLLVR